MTRKDYVLIAAAIVATQDRIKEKLGDPASRSSNVKLQMDEQLRGVRRAAAQLAEALGDDNPNFDAGRFLTACGYDATTDERERAWRESKPIPPRQSVGVLVDADVERAISEGKHISEL